MRMVIEICSPYESTIVGEGNASRRIATAERVREGLHYKNERSLAFSIFLDCMQKMFSIYEEEGEEFDGIPNFMNSSSGTTPSAPRYCQSFKGSLRYGRHPVHPGGKSPYCRGLGAPRIAPHSQGFSLVIWKEDSRQWGQQQ